MITHADLLATEDSILKQERTFKGAYKNKVDV